MATRKILRAVLFVVRVQKSLSRKSKRNTMMHRTFVRRSQSTRCRKCSNDAQKNEHRLSAPNVRPVDQSEVTGHSSKQFDEDYSFSRSFLTMGESYKVSTEHIDGRDILCLQTSHVHRMATRSLQQRFTDPTFSVDSQSTSINKSANAERNEGNSKGRSSTYSLDQKMETNPVGIIEALIAVQNDDLPSLKYLFTKIGLNCNTILPKDFFNHWSLLEIALLLNHTDCAILLWKNGAKTYTNLCSQSEQLKYISEVERKLSKEIKDFRKDSSKVGSKRMRGLECNLSQMARMRETVKGAEYPEKVRDLQMEVTAFDRITLRWSLPPQFDCKFVINYKVEWSLCSNFELIEGTLIVDGFENSMAEICGLKPSLKYFLRISAGTLRGYSKPTIANPHFLFLSSWNDVRDCTKIVDYSEQISTLFDDIEKFRSSPLWQTIFPKRTDMSEKKRKSRFQNLFSASSKFVKFVKRGIYLVTLIFSDEKILFTVDDTLPIIAIDENSLDLSTEDMHWAMKLSVCCEEAECLIEPGSSWPPNAQFRASFIEAIYEMRNALGIKNIGRLYHKVISDQNTGSMFLITIRSLRKDQVVQGLAVRWNALGKMVRKTYGNSSFDTLSKEILPMLNFFESSHISLQKGLYLCYLKLHSTVNSINIVVPEYHPSILPYAFIRENSHVTKEEWEWLRLIDINAQCIPTDAQLNFHKSLVAAAIQLLNDLEINENTFPLQRLYRLRIISVQPNISFIILLPTVENVCSGPSHQPTTTNESNKCATLPALAFEMIHLCTYDEQFIRTYCRLSLFIERFIMIIQYELRNCLLENDAKVYRGLLVKLNEFQQRLENVWKSARWLQEVAFNARNKHSGGTIPLGRLLATMNKELAMGDDDYIGTTVDTVSLIESKSTSPSLLDRRHSYTRRPRSSSPPNPLQWRKKNHSARVVRIYPAYDCGLPEGASVRLQITLTTTSYQVVSLVVEQLAKTANAANTDPTIDSIDPEDCCLVSVLGSRERRIRDEFPLLKLQYPWSTGRLYVRLKNRVLDAVQRGNEALV